MCGGRERVGSDLPVGLGRDGKCGGHCHYRVCDTGSVCIMEEEKLSGYLGAGVCGGALSGGISRHSVQWLCGGGTDRLFHEILFFPGVGGRCGGTSAVGLFGVPPDQMAYPGWCRAGRGRVCHEGPETGPCVRLLASGDLCAG